MMIDWVFMPPEALPTESKRYFNPSQKAIKPTATMHGLPSIRQSRFPNEEPPTLFSPAKPKSKAEATPSSSKSMTPGDAKLSTRSEPLTKTMQSEAPSSAVSQGESPATEADNASVVTTSTFRSTASLIKNKFGFGSKSPYKAHHEGGNDYPKWGPKSDLKEPSKK